MNQIPPTVMIVDDDPAVLKSLSRLLRSARLAVMSRSTHWIAGSAACGLLLSGFGGGPGLRFFHQLLDLRAAQHHALPVDLVP